MGVYPLKKISTVYMVYWIDLNKFQNKYMFFLMTSFSYPHILIDLW